MVADGIQQDTRNKATQLVGIAIPEGVKKRPSVHFEHGIGEPRSNGLGKNPPHFLVGNDKEGLIFISLPQASICSSEAFVR